MLNQCCIVGRLGRDPEPPRQAKNGNPVLTFSIACDRDFKSPDGNRETDWIPIVCFGATADFVSRYAKQGRMLCVNGRLQIRTWSDDNGAKKQKAEIVASNVYFADTPPQNGQRENGRQQGGYPQGYGGGYQGGYGH